MYVMFTVRAISKNLKWMITIEVSVLGLKGGECKPRNCLVLSHKLLSEPRK